MSEELKKFFDLIAADRALQERLYVTKEIAYVAVIANELGFKVTGADILRAQAGRVLELPPQELEDAAAGRKPKSGAQWGRGGRGYLESAGYWVNELIQWGYFDPAFDRQLETFLLKVREDRAFREEILSARTYNDVATIATRHGDRVSGTALLRYQATQILNLNDAQAEQVARGGG